MSGRMSTLRSDQLLNDIVKKYISLDERAVETTNQHLHEVLKCLMEKMKRQDSLFSELFREVAFTGSFYKGTRVAKPEEFDLILVLRLPKDEDFEIVEGHLPGLVMLKRVAKQSVNQLKNRQLPSWMQDYLVDKDKLRQWIEGIFDKTLQCLPKEYVGPVDYSVLIVNGKKYHVSIHKCGPAFTLKLVVHCRCGVIAVDLVPVFQFSGEPPSGFRKFTRGMNDKWCLVPKPIENVPQQNYLWRVAFSEQEKDILSQNGRCKIIIRLIKKMRDSRQWNEIYSYLIETLFYNELLNESFKDKLNSSECSYSNTEIFVEMLKRLGECCRTSTLWNYWCPKMNMFGNANKQRLLAIASDIARIVHEIEQNPRELSTFILRADELGNKQLI